MNFDLQVPRCYAATCISPSLVHLLLWSPYGIGQTIIFLFCDFFFISFFPRLLSAVADIRCLPYFHIWRGLNVRLGEEKRRRKKKKKKKPQDENIMACHITYGGHKNAVSNNAKSVCMYTSHWCQVCYRQYGLEVVVGCSPDHESLQQDKSILDWPLCQKVRLRISHYVGAISFWGYKSNNLTWS